MSTDLVLQHIKQPIKAEALRLGFAACGVASLEPVDPENQSRFAQWTAHGRQAGMDYMNRYTAERMDPSLLLKDARSILSLALNYFPAQLIAEKNPQIAWYAYGKDYHEVMRKKLHELLLFIRTLLPVEGRICVDTAPLLERYWAQKAGIGWIGKNTQLIIPKAGSCFFLGEILLEARIPPDDPAKNQCGNCEQCLKACPAQALCAPFTLDAHKCLSYQTIENRGPLSEESKRAIGNRIYGCDECQKACPHQRFASPTSVSAFHPSPELLQMTGNKWANLTPEEYRQLFKGSAVKRVKYEGLMRNIRQVCSKKS